MLLRLWKVFVENLDIRLMLMIDDEDLYIRLMRVFHEFSGGDELSILLPV